MHFVTKFDVFFLQFAKNRRELWREVIFDFQQNFKILGVNFRYVFQIYE